MVLGGRENEVHMEVSKRDCRKTRRDMRNRDSLD